MYLSKDGISCMAILHWTPTSSMSPKINEINYQKILFCIICPHNKVFRYIREKGIFLFY